jgi:hypothetical protein
MEEALQEDYFLAAFVLLTQFSSNSNENFSGKIIQGLVVTPVIF